MRPTEKDIPATPCVTESATFAVPVMNKPFHSVSVLVISSVKMGIIICKAKLCTACNIFM